MSASLLGLGFRADMGTCIRKLVLLKLVDACEEDGTRIFPAIATVARAAQCSERQVQREIRAFVEAGLLRLVREGGKGPRSTNEYALDIDMLMRLAREGWNGVVGRPAGACEVTSEGACEAAGDAEKGDTESPLLGEKGDSGDALRVTPETPKGDTWSHPTPPDPSIDPSSRESAREPDGQERPDEPGERPGTAAFQKRVTRFLTGSGFRAGVWRDWDTQGSLDWVARQFARLSAEERAEAERWRDPYLLDIAARRKAPQPPGVWLRDRVWTALDPALLDRAEKRRTVGLSAEERAMPDGWGKCLGPVGMAWLFAVLLSGPKDPFAAEAAAKMPTDMRLRAAWPEILSFRQHQRQTGGVVFGDRWHALRSEMEPVPKGSAMMARWQEAFAARGWPWLPEFVGPDVMWCPRDGPDGLEAFRDAVTRNGRREGSGDDGGGQEAA